MSRLIDVDKLIDNLDDMILADDGGDYAMGIATAIQEAGRMAYEDYVKAIPIEWIYQWSAKHMGKWLSVADMLEEWEKENE